MWCLTRWRQLMGWSWNKNHSRKRKTWKKEWLWEKVRKNSIRNEMIYNLLFLHCISVILTWYLVAKKKIRKKVHKSKILILFFFLLPILPWPRFIVFLQCSTLFTGLWKFSFFESISHHPMNECPPCIQKVKFVIYVFKSCCYITAVWKQSHSPRGSFECTIFCFDWPLVVKCFECRGDPILYL